MQILVRCWDICAPRRGRRSASIAPTKRAYAWCKCNVFLNPSLSNMEIDASPIFAALKALDRGEWLVVSQNVKSGTAKYGACHVRGVVAARAARARVFYSNKVDAASSVSVS